MTTTITMPAATTTTATAAPTIELLTLLHRYESLHSSANDHLKSSIWNITKARRGRAYQGSGGGAGGFGGVEYSADDVREELRAQALLEWKEGDGDEPTLLNEDSSDDCGVKNHGGGPSSSGDGRFVLHLDGMKAAQQQQQQRGAEDSYQAETITVNVDDKENEGLRRRRGNANSTPEQADGETKTNKKWTLVEESATTDINEEEERLRNADPLNLFGVPPPALRVAQAKSRSAVAYYVEVANLAKEIMKIINKESGEQIEKK
ncbi:hypothetical protein ACHAXR_010340 [Thalassiosira sp. AJA248-18]